MNNIKNALINDGFVILKDVFTDETLSQAVKVCEEVEDYFNSDTEVEDPFSLFFMKHRIDQGVLYDVFFKHSIFHKFVYKSKILDALELVLGKDIFLYENSLVYKPKGKRNEVPWHQDFINRPDEPIKYIAWCALDNVTKENGPLKIIKGSHKKGFGNFFHVEGETHHTRLDTSDFDTSKFEVVTLKKGDVLIFNQLVIHSSDRVEVTTPRRVFRFAVQGFSEIFSPRAVPVVLRGGAPSNYPKIKDMNQNSSVKKENFLKRIIRKILS